MMIKLTPYAHKTIAVLGLGISGTASAKALLHSNATVLAWDDNEQSRHHAHAHNIPIVDLHTVDFSTIDALLISPGIADTNSIAQLAVSHNCPLIGEIKLLADTVKQPFYIGITGTNGKSTTTALIHHILQCAGKTSVIGGNFGTPAVSLPTLTQGQYYILEMSSYMLERLEGMHFDYGIFLNLTNDHLQRHKTMDKYLQAKMHLFDSMDKNDTAIVCIDDQYGKALSTRIPHTHVVTVSHTDIQGDYPYLKGQHNKQNIACCVALAKSIGIDDTTIQSALKSFTGLAHRQEFVTKKGHVTFINDSKATNTQSAQNALSAYTNILWIAGGQEKGTYTDLIPYLHNVKCAYLIGEGADNIADFLAKHDVSYKLCHTLDIAVQCAYDDSTVCNKDTTVLLSPACASWDQFKSFEDRGDHFKAYIDTLTP